MNVFNVHSNRSPVDGVVKERWYFSGAFVNAALDKASLDNERNALWIRTRDGADVTCVQVAGLIARRILCYVEAGAELERGQRFGFIRFGSRVDLLPAARRPGEGGDRRQGVRSGERARMAEDPDDERRSSERAHAAAAGGCGWAAPPRHLPAAQLVHHRGAVLRLLRHRAGDERPLRGRRDRHLRRHGARRHGRARGALDQHAERVRRAVRQHRRHGGVRRRAGPDRLHLGAEGSWARWAGSAPSSTAPAPASASRASTPTSRWSTSATSRGCPAPPARR